MNKEFLVNSVKIHEKNMKEKQETLDTLKGVADTIKKVNANYARELIYEAKRQLLFCKRAFERATEALKKYENTERKAKKANKAKSFN